MKTVVGKRRVSKKKVAFGVILIYIAINGLGILSCNWHNNISNEKYLQTYKEMNSIGHPRSMEEIENLKKLPRGELIINR